MGWLGREDNSTNDRADWRASYAGNLFGSDRLLRWQRRFLLTSMRFCSNIRVIQEIQFLAISNGRNRKLLLAWSYSSPTPGRDDLTWFLSGHDS